MVLLAVVFAFLVYTKYRAKRIERTDAIEDEEESLQTHLDTDGIPFGARALQRGIKIDGIWLSDTYTSYRSLVQPGAPDDCQTAHSHANTPRQSPFQPSVSVDCHTITIARPRSQLPDAIDEDHDPRVACQHAPEVQVKDHGDYRIQKDIHETPVDGTIRQAREVDLHGPESYDTSRKGKAGNVDEASLRISQDNTGCREPSSANIEEPEPIRRSGTRCQ